jgi:outer membrane protein assembly factor BamB
MSRIPGVVHRLVAEPWAADLDSYAYAERTMRSPRLAVATSAALFLLISGCASASTTSSATGRPASAASSSAAVASPSGPASTANKGDWTSYHRTNDRAGLAPTAPAAHGLRQAWNVRLDGAVYGQPLVLGDLVSVATEGDSVYGLSLAGGQVRWRRHLGSPVALRDLPCGNIDPLGITGTPAYDAQSGSVFMVSESTGARHDLVAIDPATGAVRFTRNLDVTTRDRHAEQQRGALAVSGGRVYVPFGALPA